MPKRGGVRTGASGGSQRRELNIGAGTLDRPIEDVVATLLHEMTHLWNLQRGVQDCSRGGAYHNKRFKEAAEARGLSIGYDPRYGWTITEPTEALLDFIISQGWTDVHMGREEGCTGKGPGKPTGGRTTATGPKPSSTRKLVCPKCRQSVRATKEVYIICGNCMERMLEV